MAYDPQSAYQPPNRHYYPQQQQQRAPMHDAQAYGHPNAYKNNQYSQEGDFDDSAYDYDMSSPIHQANFGNAQRRGDQNGYPPQQHNGRRDQNGYGPQQHNGRGDQSGYRPQQHSGRGGQNGYGPQQHAGRGDQNGYGSQQRTGREEQVGYGPQYQGGRSDMRQENYSRPPPHRTYDQRPSNSPKPDMGPPQGHPVYQQPQFSHSNPHQARGPPLSPLASSHSLDYPRSESAQSRSQRPRPPPLERMGSGEQNQRPQQKQSRRPLIEPVSPTTLPQDNAFPLFPTPKKQGSKQPTEDDKADSLMTESKPPSDRGGSQSNGYPNDANPRSPINSPTFALGPPRPGRQNSNDSAGHHGNAQHYRGPSPQSQSQGRGGPAPPEARFNDRPPTNSRGAPEYNNAGSNHLGPNQRRPSPPGQGYTGQAISEPNQGYSGHNYSNQGQSGQIRPAQGYPEQGRPTPPPHNGPTPFHLPHRPGTALSADRAPQRAPSHGKSNSQSEIYANGYIDDIGQMQTSPDLSRDAQIESEMPNFDDQSASNHKRGKTIDEHLKSPPQQHQPPMPLPTNPQMYQNQNGARSSPNIRGPPGPVRTPSGGNTLGPHPANQPPKPAYYQEQYQNRPPAGGPMGGPNGHAMGGPTGGPMQGYGPRPIPQRPGTADQYGRPSFDNNRSFDSQSQPGRAPSAPPAPLTNNFGAPLSKQTSANSSTNSNPDALPQHPVPVRPGLMNGGYNNQSPQNRREQDPRMAGPPQAQPQARSHPPPAGSASPTDSRRSSVHVPVTQAEINQLQSLVNAHPQDAATALLLAKKLVEASNVLASENGRLDARQTSKNRERYIFDAHRRVKKLVSSGYPDAMFYLADCYGQGLLGLEEDPKEAFTLYQQAAKAGHGQAAYRTAMCCEIGPDEGGGTRRDPQKAVQWYRRAAQLQDVAAMYKLGVICLKGLLSEPKNVVEAERWLKRAADKADKENPHALHELGMLYEPDHADRDVRAKIIPDEKYSRELFFRAAQMGFMKSQFRLGQAYEYGALGLPVDARNSIAWYSKSAAQGEHQAELALSGWYLTGAEGILQNSDTEAYLWARKAAMADPPLAKAMFAMGYYTETGIGCPANLEEAKRWYGRAASYKFPKAIDRLEEIKRTGGKMPKEQKGARLQRKDIKDKVK
ncbi:hypothetical protein K461DRAFT_281843 [Myriangium duriaei CBS 260.36]|uniref:Uncharacterized protein n=1 Tax=Myriangium duriaei CBS 260.36 TaxID=1168546 RepID=A0A9P4IX53_9PEZI|nr:hypothetical protein K461DRAFT_281843 [Myriangium duriaei CBS 260.36]